MSVSAILKWLAAVGAVGVVAGLKAIAVAIGIPVSGIDPVVQLVVAAVIVKVVNWLVGKIPLEG